jgi:SAM-dependent methyltransferase
MLSKRFIGDEQSLMPLNKAQLEALNTFHKKLADNSLQYEAVNCLCGEDDAFTLACKDRYGIPLKTVICKKCGQVYSKERLDPPSSEIFYSSLYRELYVGKDVADERFFNKQHRRGNRIFSFLEPYRKKQHQNVLEIGCGAGGILYPFLVNGDSVFGIDLGERYLEFGRSLGLELACMSSHGLQETRPQHYDVIVLSHVLEHFSSIENELTSIQALLKEDGLLYIEVPGLFNLKESYDCDFLKYLQNAHNYHFNLATLKNTLAREGFTFIAGDESIRAVFKKGRVSTTNTENQYDSIKTFLELLEGERESLNNGLQQKKVDKHSERIVKLEEYINRKGAKSIALYGTGQHTSALLNDLKDDTKTCIDCILTPRLDSQVKSIDGIEVTTLECVKPDVIIISSDSFQESIARRLEYLKNQGTEIISLYE